MQLLIIAATKVEIESLIEKQYSFSNVEVDILVSGVGMVATTFALTKALIEKKYDLVLNAGIAGSFDSALEIGYVVEIVEDRISELGAEDAGQFLDAFEIGFAKKEEVVLKSSHSFETDLKKCNGITVNKVHGSEESIKEIISRINPDVESMEGAAVFYVCDMLNVQCVQIRAISNKVEPRNKNNWDIQKAIINLNINLDNFISRL